MDPVIKVENLGKKYVIRHQGQASYDTLRDTIVEQAKNVLKRLVGKSKPNKNTEEFWALKNINFEVEKGQRIGIIGRNGAGKSTLLKILSRITRPTTGRAILRGKVSSLLEVGTGFHPELTGRENIFLNGAILGMSKAEITKNFEDIVSFSEIGSFLDTPVKRYSSGMYVRLAFAVAAHLQPEILIVDEVLAVGDIQFQKKCLGKMEYVSHEEGRTILFVSHNMSAILQLCNSAILLDSGQIISSGEVRRVVNDYLKTNIKQNGQLNEKAFYGPLKSTILFSEIIINGENGSGISISPSSEIEIQLKGSSKTEVANFAFTLSIYKNDIQIFTTHDYDEGKSLPKGDFEVVITIPAYFLRPGSYTIAIGGGQTTPPSDYLYGTNLMQFEVIEEWSKENAASDVGLVNLSHSVRKVRRIFHPNS